MNQEAVIGNRDLNFIQRYNWGWKRSTALALIPILIHILSQFIHNLRLYYKKLIQKAFESDLEFRLLLP